jgi:CRISPR-associated protein Csh1
MSYLLSQTIPNLVAITLENNPLNKLLRLVLKEMFADLKFSGRGRYLLDWKKVNILGEKLQVFDNSDDSLKLKKGYEEYVKLSEIPEKEQDDKKKKEKTEKGKDLSKGLIKAIESKIWESIKTKKQLTKKEVSLFTLKINDKLMIDDEEYREIIIKEKIDSLFEQDKKKTCSCCNERKPFTDSPKFAKAKSALGCYITDKIGFSSELSGEFSKNFILCKDCYKEVLVGEVFVRNNLRSYIGGLDLYIIPKFLFPIEFSSEKMSRWAEYIQGTFNSAKYLQGLRMFEDKLEEYRDFEAAKNNFILNLLFWRKGTGAETRVLRLIKDVPPTRLDTLRKTASAIKDKGDILLGNSDQWVIDLQNIYYLIPLKKTQNDIEYRKILSLYDAIFAGKPVSYSFLISQFVELAQIYKFKITKSYHITAKADNWDEEKWNKELINSILRDNLFLLYLRRLNLLKVGGENMDYNSLQLNEQIKNFLKELGYDEPKIALFLLGYLIGEIGNAQSRLTESRTKPILNKITFEGMNSNKLIRLTNEVFEKLNQYKVFSKKDKTRVPLLVFYGGVFAEYKSLIDKQIKNWDFPDHESVFYVLSGFAYATHKAPKTSLQEDQNEQMKRGVKGNE